MRAEGERAYLRMDGIVRVSTLSERTHWYRVTTHSERALVCILAQSRFARTIAIQHNLILLRKYQIVLSLGI